MPLVAYLHADPCQYYGCIVLPPLCYVTAVPGFSALVFLVVVSCFSLLRVAVAGCC